MEDDRKPDQGGSKQGGRKQAPGRLENDEGTGGRQGNKGSEHGGQKGGKQSNR